MDKQSKDKSIDPRDLPQSEVFIKKEVFQHPQPAGQGKPLNAAKPNPAAAAGQNEEEKTSKTEGLNEVHSAGKAGAFEGFESQD